ncbi:hypothetical protein DRJ17_00795 [Candidatus Woesearchaeota archaeon]|nr:MAG: hypothetical protein DRJ17_00795 [Candidatus Woesearchaeota archaeon]
MAQTEYTTVAIVKARVGENNIGSDVQDSEISQWIQEASNFIDLSTKKVGVGFEQTDPLYPTVQQIVTDLAVIKLILRMSGAGKATTAGLSYRIGEFSVDKKNIDSSSAKEIQVYEKSAKDSLKALKEYLGIDNGGFTGAAVIEGEPAPTTNFGENTPQQP